MLPNGSIDTSFGLGGYYYSYDSLWCSDPKNPFKLFVMPQAMINDFEPGKTIVSSNQAYACPASTIAQNVRWQRFSKKGIPEQTFLVRSNFYWYGGGPSSFLLKDRNYFLYQIGGNGFSTVNNYFKFFEVAKTTWKGSLDSSFGNNGVLRTDTFNSGPSSNNYSQQLLRINDSTTWYARFIDTILLSQIKTNFNRSVYDIYVNQQTVGFGDVCKLSAYTSTAFQSVQWFFPSSVRYLNGTNSTSPNPVVQFTQPGSYTITCRFNYKDTAIVVTKPDFILMQPQIDFTSNLTAVKSKNDTLMLSAQFNGVPISYYWQFASNGVPVQVQYLLNTDSTSMKPAFQLTHAGKYDVTLVVKYQDTTLSLTKNLFLQTTWLGLDQHGSNQVKIYPNPTASSITIELGNTLEPATLEVFDLSGRLLLEQRLNATVTESIHLPDAPGIYLIKITSSGAAFVGRVVKEE